MTDNNPSRGGRGTKLVIAVIAIVAVVIVLFALAFATGGSHKQVKPPAASTSTG